LQFELLINIKYTFSEKIEQNIYITLEKNKIRKKYRPQYLDALSKADEKNLFSKELGPYKGLVQFNTNEFVLNYWNNFL
jgi:regulator of replication initiation timing